MILRSSHLDNIAVRFPRHKGRPTQRFAASITIQYDDPKRRFVCIFSPTEYPNVPWKLRKTLCTALDIALAKDRDVSDIRLTTSRDLCITDVWKTLENPRFLKHQWPTTSCGPCITNVLKTLENPRFLKHQRPTTSCGICITNVLNILDFPRFLKHQWPTTSCGLRITNVLKTLENPGFLKHQRPTTLRGPCHTDFIPV